jgi:hypothetical protein
MEGFTQYCIWFLFASVVVELCWKGWKKYQEDIDCSQDKEAIAGIDASDDDKKTEISLSPLPPGVVRRSKRLNKEKDLEEEKKNKD